MWKIVPIAAEPLDPAYFAPYGQVISSFDERHPDKVKGGYATGEYQVWAACSSPRRDAPSFNEITPHRPPLSEGLRRAHFAFHTDCGQSFFPKYRRPAVFLVGGVGPDIQAEELRAFYSDGSTGVCLHLGYGTPCRSAPIGRMSSRLAAAIRTTALTR